jgi:hypothetical protein
VNGSFRDASLREQSAAFGWQPPDAVDFDL